MNFNKVISIKKIFADADREYKKMNILKSRQLKEYKKSLNILSSLKNLFKLKETKRTTTRKTKTNKPLKAQTPIICNIVDEINEPIIEKPVIIAPLIVSKKTIKNMIRYVEPIYKCFKCKEIKTVYKYEDVKICSNCFNFCMIENNKDLRIITEDIDPTIDINNILLKNVYITRPYKNTIIEEEVVEELKEEIKEEVKEEIKEEVTVVDIKKSSLEYKINNNIDNKLIFGIFKKYDGKDYISYKYFNNYDEVYNNDFNACEFLETNYKNDQTYLKLYFDIESDDENFLNNYDDIERDNLIKYFLQNLLKYLSTIYDNIRINKTNILKSIVITKSENISYKMSYHILFNEITFTDKKIMKQLINNFLKSELYENVDQLINGYKVNFPDMSVYNKNGFLRCINQTKINKNNKLKIVKILNDYEDSVDKSYYFINTIKKGLIHDDNIFNEDKQKNTFTEDNETNINKDIIIEILENLNIDRASNYDLWMNIFFILRGLNINYINIFKNFSKRTNKNNYDEKYIDNIWNKYLYNENNNKLKFPSLLLYLKEDNKIKFDEIIKKINKLNNDSVINQTINNYYNINENNTINKYILKLDELDENIFLKPDLLLNRDEKAILLKSHLGTGKTSSMVSIIKKYILNRKRILILTPRILYAVSNNNNLNGEINKDDNIIKLNKKLKKDNINFTLYNDESCTFQENFLICQVESLHKIKNTNYDLIIADEVEGILERFNINNLECHKTNYINNYNAFQELLNNCTKFIGCDAFINNNSINLVNDIFINDSKILIINEVNPYNRICKKFNNKEILIENITDKLNNNKKIVLFICSKKEVINYENHFKEIFKNKKIITHHGDKIKKEQYNILEDVNKNWKGDLLIFNSVITVGINFNVLNYDELYIIADNYIIVRDIFQASLRVRHLKDNKLNYHIMKKDNLNSLFNYNDIKNNINDKMDLIKKYTINTDNLFDSPEWLKNLIINLSYEFELNKNYFESTFNYFLNICGYKSDANNEDIKKGIKKNKIKLDYLELNKILDDKIKSSNKSIFEIREEITIKQKTGNIDDINDNYIKELIDFQRLIKLDCINDNDKINDLFNIYIDKHNNYFKNIQLLYSFEDPKEAQEYINNKYKNQISIIRPIGQQIDTIKNIFKILNINKIENIIIDNETYKKIYNYIEENEKNIKTSFNIRMRVEKEKNNIKCLIKQIIKNFCNIDLNNLNKYGKLTNENNKKYKIDCIFNNIEFNLINNNNDDENLFINN
jgi:hypothetical protein